MQISQKGCNYINIVPYLTPYALNEKVGLGSNSHSNWSITCLIETATTAPILVGWSFLELQLLCLPESINLSTGQT